MGIILTNAEHLMKVPRSHLRQIVILNASQSSLCGFNRFTVSRKICKDVVKHGTRAQIYKCNGLLPRRYPNPYEAYRQREVGCEALDAVENKAMKGDIGWSPFAVLEINTIITFDGRFRHKYPYRWVFSNTSLDCNAVGRDTCLTDPVKVSSAAEWESKVRKNVLDQKTQY